MEEIRRIKEFRRAYIERDDVLFEEFLTDSVPDDKAIAAAKRIIENFEHTNKMLPLAGGIAYPIETSTDSAVVMAREIMRMSV